MKGSTLIRVLREIEKQTNKNRVRRIEKESGKMMLKINYMYFYYMSVSFEPLYMLVYSQKFIHI